MADPSKRLRSSGGASGSAVVKEPFQHLIQHVKQVDPMLYEALRKISEDLIANTEDVQTAIENIFQDKCTFGLVKTLTVDTGLTLYYIVRKAGSFVDFTAKIKTQAPTGSSAILDVVKSTDDGATWNSIFLPGSTNKIVLPAGKTATVIVKKFAISGVSVGNLLRIDCTQIGSTDPGKGIEIVGRWS